MGLRNQGKRLEINEKAIPIFFGMAFLHSTKQKIYPFGLPSSNDIRISEITHGANKEGNRANDTIF
jgi:hypothetical protein